MAAAHGALTGRPAVSPRHARGRGGEPRDRPARGARGLRAAHRPRRPGRTVLARGREAFQEIDVVASVGALCRWAREVRDVSALPSALDEALRRATTGRPGPVLLSLPEDLLDEAAPTDPGRIATATVLGPPRAPEPDPITVKRILRLLLDAERPVVLAGAGVLRSRATADLVRFAELVDIPVISAWRRPDVFPNDHALYLGMSGYFAAPTVPDRLLAADAILVLGCRLNEMASHGWSVPAAGARWAHVDLEPLGARPGLEAPTIALAADARTFVREARRLLAGTVLEMASLERRRAANAADRAAYEEARIVDSAPWDGPGVHPGRVIATLGQRPGPGHDRDDRRWSLRWLGRAGPLAPPTRAPTWDELPARWATACRPRSPRRSRRPGERSSPSSATVASRCRVAELETAVREGARPTVLVFDNARYGTIRDHQDRRGMAPAATDLGSDRLDGGGEGPRRRRGAGRNRRGVRADAAGCPRDAATQRVIHLIVDRRWVSVDRLDDAAARRSRGRVRRRWSGGRAGRSGRAGRGLRESGTGRVLAAERRGRGDRRTAGEAAIPETMPAGRDRLGARQVRTRQADGNDPRGRRSGR